MKTPFDLPKAAMYEQLAEEAVELARKLRNENPTPVTTSYIEKAISEEYADVVNVANLLGLYTDPDIISEKNARWIERLNEKR